MVIPNILMLRNYGANSRALWGNILFTLLLFVIVLYLFEVPQNIHTGKNGQIALKELDGMNQPLINIKVVMSQFQFDGNIHNAISELKRQGERAESCIHHYRDAADYSDSSSKNAAGFATAYYEWFDAEHEYLELYSESLVMKNHNTYDKKKYLEAIQHENNIRYLAAIEQLHNGEPPLHDDIAKGQKAYKILQWASGLIIVYLFTAIFLFQRGSNREHIIREKNLEMTLRSIGEAVIATDIHGNVTSMNPEAERLTGCSFEDAKGCALSETFKVVSEHSGELIDDLVEQVKKESGVVVMAEDSVLIASNGKRYKIYENGAPIYDDAGLLIGVVLVFRDITQEHKLKKRLNENALRLQRVIDSSMDAVIVMDEQGIISQWNPAAENMFGWSYAEVRKQKLHELIVPEEFRELHLQGMRRLIEDNKKTFMMKRIESLALHRDGHTFPIDLAMTSIKTEDSWVFNAFVRDLTIQNKNKLIIENSNLLLRETQHIAKLGYCERDLVTDVLQWSDEMYKILALDADNAKPSHELFINTVHPDDKERVNAAYIESEKNKIPYNLIHQIVTNEGIKTVHGQCRTIFDADGNPLRSLGILQDITERIGHLDELRLASTIFKTSTGILITDSDGIITRVNPALERMTGYTSMQLVGKNPRILQSGKQSDVFYKDMWDKLVKDGLWQGEICNKRKDGTFYTEWLTITAVKNDANEVMHFVGTSLDITEVNKLNCNYAI